MYEKSKSDEDGYLVDSKSHSRLDWIKYCKGDEKRGIRKPKNGWINEKVQEDLHLKRIKEYEDAIKQRKIALQEEKKKLIG